jgi:hypothetical protein
MSDRFSALHKRLDKVQLQLMDFAVVLELENCICLESFDLDDPEQFAAEMNRSCPAHGIRLLGYRSPKLKLKDKKHLTPEKFVKLSELVETYERRLEQLPQYYVDLGDD